jgi:hypothetical protein
VEKNLAIKSQLHLALPIRGMMNMLVISTRRVAKHLNCAAFQLLSQQVKSKQFRFELASGGARIEFFSRCYSLNNRRKDDARIKELMRVGVNGWNGAKTGTGLAQLRKDLGA